MGRYQRCGSSISRLAQLSRLIRPSYRHGVESEGKYQWENVIGNFYCVGTA
jgi:hypothetical protein